jgi:hypothetical protein
MRPELNRVPSKSSLLTLVSGGFLFSGSCSVNAARTLAVSQAKSGATGSWRSGKQQFMAQAKPSSLIALTPVNEIVIF